MNKVKNTSKKKIGIVNYGMGNLGSVSNCINLLGYRTFIAQTPDDIASCDALVLPGVGAFPAAMKNLQDLKLIKPIEKLILDKQKPFLGICLGLQMLAKKSFENIETNGLGWIEGNVIRFPEDQNIKIPHVGWNRVNLNQSNPISEGLDNFTHFYFDHSYYLDITDDSSFANCNYGLDFCVGLQKDNIFAVQFHPEKSQRNGLKFMRNFLNYVEE